MIVGVDGHCLGDRSGGNETYWTNLIDNLIKFDETNKYVIYLNEEVKFKEKGSNYIRINYKSGNTFWRNMIYLPQQALFNKFDLIHTQYFMPIGTKKKSIVTIHDISYEHYPECFSKKFLLINKALVKQAAKSANYIITISEFSKQDLVKTYNIDPNRVFVTYLGASDIFRVIDNGEVLNRVKQKYEINDRYILVVGNLQPRKNLGRLIEAFKKIKNNKDLKEYKLVIVGKKSWANNGIINGVDFTSYANDIIFTGYVPDEDLPYLYNGCDVFVYPSIFEGFGLPVLEAMKCGAAVLTSNTSSIPEVVGDSGVLFDPFDVNDIFGRLERILLNEQERLYFKAKAVEHAKMFSWENTAKETKKVYEKLKCLK